MTESAVLRVVVGLALVIAAILVSAWLARRSGLIQRHGGALLRQVGGMSLGPRQRVVVLEIEDTWLVLGVTPNQLTALHTLPAGQLPDPSPAAAGTFAAKLGQALQRGHRVDRP
ncbi:flagellar biosynthetic protein FliO [Bordetella bronchiseptica]